MKKCLHLVTVAFLVILSCLVFCSCENEKKPENTPESNSETTAQTQPEETKPFYPASEAPESLKVLAVGNSFSQDTFAYLGDIAKAAGVKDYVFGNLVIGGCTLQTHLKHVEENDAAYTYEKNDNGKVKNNPGYRYKRAVTDEEWDVIIFQQQSGNSGVASSYQPYLNEIIGLTDSMKTNPDVRYFWNMTWAYQKDYTGSAFSTYNRDQSKMYGRIVETVQSEITKLDVIKGIIPIGTAIQNARTSFVGDTLNRDGIHLDLTLGRLIAGLTCYAAVTLDDISDIEFVPSKDFTPEQLEVARESVMNAMNKPYEVTKSEHT